LIRPSGEKMDEPKLTSLLSIKLLQREIKKIAGNIGSSASSDDLDRAWATLCRLQDALALVMERAKALAD
jgi:hypothetical protein